MRKFWNILVSLAETLASGLVVVLLYILYIPFGVFTALFSKEMITEFFQSVLYTIERYRQGLFGKERL